MHKNNKISVKQFCLIFIMAALGVCVSFISSAGNVQSVWLSPLLSFSFFALLGAIMCYISNYQSLFEALKRAFGKVGTRIVLFIYFAWLTILAAMHTRIYAERLLTLIIPNAAPSFILIMFLFLILLILRGGIVPLARFCELSLLILGATLIALFLALIFDVSPENLTMPIVNVSNLKASVPMASAYSFLLLPFFFIECLSSRKNLKRNIFISGALISIFCAAITALLVGILGAQLAANMPYPFFVAVKNITLLSPLNHLEPLVLAVWIFMDFLSVAALALAATKAFGVGIGCPFTPLSPEHQKKLQRTKELLLLAFCATLFLIALFAFPNQFVLQSFIKSIAPAVDGALFFALPLVLFIVLRIKQAAK